MKPKQNTLYEFKMDGANLEYIYFWGESLLFFQSEEVLLKQKGIEEWVSWLGRVFEITGEKAIKEIPLETLLTHENKIYREAAKKLVLKAQKG